MKTLLPLLALLCCLACGETTTTSSPEVDTTSPTELVPENAPEKEERPEPISVSIELGSYVGDFEAKTYNPGKRPSYSNRINISIDEFTDGKIKGHSVVAGNIRPFEGTYEVVNDVNYAVRAAEPGDDRYDGVFDFLIYPKMNTIKGTWIANDPKLAVTERAYKLEHQLFEYNPENELPEDVSWRDLYDKNEEYDDYEGEFLTEDVVVFNPSKIVLKKEDIENMYQGDLEVMRNSIYARHGYSFKNRKMRYVFDTNVDWYVPISTDVRAQLTDIEKKNIDLIKRYEQHADKYYDTFGR